MITMKLITVLFAEFITEICEKSHQYETYVPQEH